MLFRYKTNKKNINKIKKNFKTILNNIENQYETLLKTKILLANFKNLFFKYNNINFNYLIPFFQSFILK